MTPAGFPHSGIHGSQLAFSFPWLFVDRYALLRLPVPRHPPCALSSLTSLWSEVVKIPLSLDAPSARFFFRILPQNAREYTKYSFRFWVCLRKKPPSYPPRHILPPFALFHTSLRSPCSAVSCLLSLRSVLGSPSISARRSAPLAYRREQAPPYIGLSAPRMFCQSNYSLRINWVQWNVIT